MHDLLARAELAIAEAHALMERRRRIVGAVEQTRAAVRASIAEMAKLRIRAYVGLGNIHFPVPPPSNWRPVQAHWPLSTQRVDGHSKAYRERAAEYLRCMSI